METIEKTYNYFFKLFKYYGLNKKMKTKKT